MIGNRPVLRRMPFRCLLRGAVVVVGLWSFPAEAQIVDLDTDLAALLTRLLAVPSTATSGARLDNLDDVATRLLSPGGLLSDVSAKIGEQGRLLDVQGGGLASLRVDLSDLRKSLDLNSQDNRTELTDLRRTVDTHTTVLMDHEQRIDRNTTDIATLTERSVAQGRDVTRLDGQAQNHEKRITVLEEAMDDNWNDQVASLAEFSGAMNERIDDIDARMGKMDARIDTANEGVALALALKSPYVPEDKRVAISGGWGSFEGENAFGLSGAVRAGSNFQIDAGLAVGAGKGSVGGRAGATFSW